MNSDLDVKAAYARASLLVAVLAFQNKVGVPRMIFQHHDWSGKDCPFVLRHQANGWSDFLAQIKAAPGTLMPVPAATIAMKKGSHQARLHQNQDSGAFATACTALAPSAARASSMRVCSSTNRSESWAPRSFQVCCRRHQVAVFSA